MRLFAKSVKSDNLMTFAFGSSFKPQNSSLTSRRFRDGLIADTNE